MPDLLIGWSLIRNYCHFNDSCLLLFFPLLRYKCMTIPHWCFCHTVRPTHFYFCDPRPALHSRRASWMVQKLHVRCPASLDPAAKERRGSCVKVVDHMAMPSHSGGPCEPTAAQRSETLLVRFFRHCRRSLAHSLQSSFAIGINQKGSRLYSYIRGLHGRAFLQVVFSNLFITLAPTQWRIKLPYFLKLYNKNICVEVYTGILVNSNLF